VNEYIRKLDELGGAVAALEEGFQSKEIQDSAFNYQKSVENENSIIVGVNKYKSETPPIEKIQIIDQKQTASQIQKIKRLRKDRDKENVNDCLTRLKTVSKTSDNIMPAILDCAKAYCTLGEISDAMRNTFGEYGRQN
jgi:methylmalonyl-CoA mutase N-terminal domain/subunit